MVVFVEDGIKVGRGEVGEVFVEEEEFGVGSAPEHEAGNTLFARGADNHVNWGDFGVVDMFVEVIDGNFTFVAFGEKNGGGVGEFLLATVVKTDGDDTGFAVFGLFFGIHEALPEFWLDRLGTTEDGEF